MAASAGAYRMAHADWTNVCVGLIAIVVGAAAKGFGTCEELHMGLDPNHGLILRNQVSIQSTYDGICSRVQRIWSTHGATDAT